MSQKSIKSFFEKSKPKVSPPAVTISPKVEINEDSNSPIKPQKINKRLRLSSDSDDCSRSPPSKMSSLESSINSDNVDKKPHQSERTAVSDIAVSNTKDESIKVEISSHIDCEKKKNGIENDETFKDDLKCRSSKMNNFFFKKGSPNDAGKKVQQTSGNDYDPTKTNYHPIDDAFWKRNEKTPYMALTKTFELINDESSRIKMTEILSNYFRSVLVLSHEDLLPSLYLSLNKLAPAFESVELGVAETTLIKAVAQSTGRSMAQVKSDCNSLGDIGTVAEQSRSNQRMMFQPAPLTVRGVFDKFKEIALLTGHSAMTKKMEKIQSLFVACKQSEAKYLMRSLIGKLRLGLAEQSVLQALALAYTLTPFDINDEWPPKILNGSKGHSTEQFKAIVDKQAYLLKSAYCECPSFDLVIPALLKYGITELSTHCKLTPGIPLKPMLAEPTKGVSEVLHRFENLEFTCEWKYDGERAQIHIPSKELNGDTVADIENASIYSRNQENNTTKYPDVLTRLNKTLKTTVKSCVIDCEAVAWDIEKKQILPFQVLSTRKRKDAKESEIKVAVCLFMFDLLYLNGEALVKKPFIERRTLLRDNFIEVEGEWQMATSLDCNTTESIQDFLEESKRGNCEGLMIKTLRGKDASYDIARRSKNWLKLKKDYVEGIGDTIDAVVLGGYLGKGKRTGVYGGFLLACYDNESEEYQTLCKIGTGFTDENLQNFSTSLKEKVIEKPRNYFRYDSSLEPDQWFDATFVWEIKCGDLSLSPVHRAGIGIVDPEKGISLRFPRFIRTRPDKTPEEATSARRIAQMYSNQDQVKNQGTIKIADEDFY